MFGFTDKQLEDDEKDVVDAHWGIAPRQALQFFGTDVMQFQIHNLLPCIGRRFWINHILDVIQKNKDKRYVISDLRFHHECDALIESLGKDNVCIVKILRPRCDSECCLSKHVSEEEFKSIKEDILLINDGSEKDLFENYMLKYNEMFG